MENIEHHAVEEDEGKLDRGHLPLRLMDELSNEHFKRSAIR
jgi:hypothetical protein